MEITENADYYAVFANSISNGEDKIEVNITNSGVSGTSYKDWEFEINDIEFYATDWLKSTNIQAKASTKLSLYNIDAFPGNITNIKVKQTGIARAITIHGRNFYDIEDAQKSGEEYIEQQIT